MYFIKENLVVAVARGCHSIQNVAGLTPTLLLFTYFIFYFYKLY